MGDWVNCSTYRVADTEYIETGPNYYNCYLSIIRLLSIGFMNSLQIKMSQQRNITTHRVREDCFVSLVIISHP